MRHNPHHADSDPEIVRQLVRQHPWATLVSPAADALVASHYPVILDDDAPELTLLTHVGRPDDELHEIGAHEMLVIVQGHHGYVSPSWYAPGATRAPTWNHTTAHLYGTPQRLDEEENLDVLVRLVAYFEQYVEHPMYLDREWGRALAKGTVGLRIPVSRFLTKRKLSQDKDLQTQRQVLAALREPGPYQHPALADDMAVVQAADRSAEAGG